MIIRMNGVKKVNVSFRQIVTTVFLIWGHLRSDYKSCRSMIPHHFVNMSFYHECVEKVPVVQMSFDQKTRNHFFSRQSSSRCKSVKPDIFQEKNLFFFEILRSNFDL
jgi:hypothetical protein